MAKVDVPIALKQDAAVRTIVERLTARSGTVPVVKADGTWGSYARLLGAYLHQTLKRPVVYISPHIDDADTAADDLQVFSGGLVATFPAWESQNGSLDATDEIGAQRLRLALWLDRMR
ncbi:MAG: hypothetical protein GX298_08965, partial [Planctomycetes bacterium]|nr:hypothetical protein [Planctomycetota bacterium]